MRTSVADYVAGFLAGQGVGHVFTVCGGGSIFLCDALARSRELGFVACHHEQGAAMAAEGYARVRNGLGAAYVTSGPGGTNAVTGVAGAWLDHVPVITVSGQTFLSQTITGHPGLRSKGVQEINIVDVVRPITKYAAMVRDPATIRYHLEQAAHLARAGRPGPVWLDIPADVQKASIEPGQLEGYEADERDAEGAAGRLIAQVADVLALLRGAKRPLVHIGQGVRIAGAAAELFELLEAARIPLLTARNANDMVDSGHALYIGRPGTFAQRGANFAVQTCDAYLAIGTRLSLAQTGYAATDYARRARVVMVDVDAAELGKGTVRLHAGIQADAGDFLRELLRQSRGIAWPDWSAWLERCKGWQLRYPPVSTAQREQAKYVNSYHLVDLLSDALGPEDVVATDMGFAFQNTHQAFSVKAGQRLMTNCGLAPMGWGLPAAIGAAVGSKRRTTCIAGDGGLMMNLQELATLAHHRLPVKLFVLNNGGYLTMRQSQAHAFEGRYMGSDEDSGISFPHFGQLAYAHRIPFWRLLDGRDAAARLNEVLEGPGPAFCEVMMDPAQEQVPKSINRRDEHGDIRQTALEDAHPYLDPAEIAANLRIEA